MYPIRGRVAVVRRLPYPVVLASASPRRRELLAGLISEFEVLAAEVDEDALTLPDPWRTAQNLAMAKARRVATQRPNALVIGGDTVVALPSIEESSEWDQLGKPADADAAAEMLRRLSGRSHAVITGVALVWPKGRQVFAETSHVTFRDLGEAELLAYAKSGEPLDKAGGYAIQGGAAGFVVSVEGSTTNVVGLPMDALEIALCELPGDARD